MRFPSESRPSAYHSRANLFADLNRHAEATTDYFKAIELEPDYYKPYHKLGAFYYYRGQYLKAAEQFRR